MNTEQNLEQALAPIAPVVCLSSLIGAPSSVSSAKPQPLSLQEAEAKLAAVKKSQEECTSDYSFWGYEGQIAYWKAAVAIFKAATLVGADHLPGVPPPDQSGVVMDVCSNIERYGNEILRIAQQRAKSLESPSA